MPISSLQYLSSRFLKALVDGASIHNVLWKSIPVCHYSGWRTSDEPNFYFSTETVSDCVLSYHARYLSTLQTELYINYIFSRRSVGHVGLGAFISGYCYWQVCTCGVSNTVRLWTWPREGSVVVWSLYLCPRSTAWPRQSVTLTANSSLCSTRLAVALRYSHRSCLSLKNIILASLRYSVLLWWTKV